MRTGNESYTPGLLILPESEERIMGDSKLRRLRIWSVLVFCVYATRPLMCQEPRPHEQPPDKASQDVIEAPPELREVILKLMGDAIAKHLDESLEKHNIKDPVEKKLLLLNYNSLFGKRAQGALDCVYVLKPGKNSEIVNRVELTIKGQIVLRYTCATGPVARPVAVLCRVQFKDQKAVVEEKIAYFSVESGWEITKEVKPK